MLHIVSTSQLVLQGALLPPCLIQEAASAMMKMTPDFYFPSNLTQSPAQSIYIHDATCGLCACVCVFVLHTHTGLHRYLFLLDGWSGGEKRAGELLREKKPRKNEMICLLWLFFVASIIQGVSLWSLNLSHQTLLNTFFPPERCEARFVKWMSASVDLHFSGWVWSRLKGCVWMEAPCRLSVSLKSRARRDPRTCCCMDESSGHRATSGRACSRIREHLEPGTCLCRWSRSLQQRAKPKHRAKYDYRANTDSFVYYNCITWLKI